MKSNSILMAAAALLALGTASCNKEENTNTNPVASFRATCEGYGDKTALDANGSTVNWVTGDAVRITGQGAAAGYKYTVMEGGSPAADFAYGDDGDEPDFAATYRAGYPYGAWSSDLSTVTLPAFQNFVEGGVAGFPMYAESGSRSLPFKNVCGLVKLSLAKPDVSVASITITTNTQVSGSFTVSNNGGQPTLAACDGGSTAVELLCGNPQSIADGQDFYIYLPARDYTTFNIDIYTDDNRVCTKNARGTISVGRSLMTTITLPANSLTFEPVVLSGEFSINSTGGKVRFASGNLQYVNGAWRFANHQYDYLGTYSSTAWDLFGWSTAANNYGMITSENISDYSGDFKDWGTAINPNGGNAPWRTLTNDEWQYLLGTNSQRDGKYGLATITGVTISGASTTLVKGLVLLPDSWASCPDGCSFTAGKSSGFTTNQYNADQWAQMEAAGAVFLPAAGYRYGTEMDDVGTDGNYWSSNPYERYYAYDMRFNGNGVTSGFYDYRGNCRSVRLVQDY